VDIVPEVFRFDGDNRAEVHDPDGADAAAIQEAIELCPVSCIYWED
jgi:ferredoxin